MGKWGMRDDTALADRGKNRASQVLATVLVAEKRKQGFAGNARRN